MKISIGSDHGGFLLKEALKEYLISKKIEVSDQGCYNTDSVDYPLFAEKVGKEVRDNKTDFGVLICTTGIGISISANKIKGIRAALVCSEDQSRLTRKHNDANIICFGAKYTKVEDAKKYLDIFLTTKFEGGRHQRRVTLIEKIEGE